MAGVLPSAVSDRGRFTPSTGLWVTALESHKWANNEESVESLRRMVGAESPRPSRSRRHAIKWARVTILNSSGRWIPTNAMKSATSIR